MENTEQSIQKQFGDAAANYATSNVHANGADLQVMLDAASLQGDEHILDAGCGAGHTALTFAPHVDRVVAYDLTASMLEQVAQLATERKLTNVNTQQGDVAQLPFGDNTFDRVVSRYSAHHWTRPHVALGEFRRVLKPGGMFILSDVVSRDDLVYDTHLQAIELLRDPSHVRDHSVVQWLSMFSSSGFDAHLVTGFEVPLRFVPWYTRINTPAANVSVLRELFANAPQNVRDHFQLAAELAADFAFAFYGAVIRGVIR